jgi:undecaprenyl diphosphate synthase
MAGSRHVFSIDKERIPLHVAIIMDGNGRWASQRGWGRTAGHRAGSKAVRTTVRLCRSLGIQTLTLYAFSVQNWGRPHSEVQLLMSLLGEFILKEWKEIMEKDIRVVHLGDLQKIPAGVRKQFTSLMQASKKNRSMTLALALSYGAREEIARAVRVLGRRILNHKLDPAQINPEIIDSVLDTRGLSDPDLIIRTGGERRISNFLLWQSAYSEYVFTPTLWPDFGRGDLLAAIADYQKRQRRFGLTSEQALASHLRKIL